MDNQWLAQDFSRPFTAVLNVRDLTAACWLYLCTATVQRDSSCPVEVGRRVGVRRATGGLARIGWYAQAN